LRSVINYFFVGILIFAAFLNIHFLNKAVFASPPVFTRKTFEDKQSDWLVCPPPKTQICHSVSKGDGDNSTDIIATSYYSDGRYLYGTIWLNSPLNITKSYSFIGYGFYIDTDIDGSPPSYQIEVNRLGNNPWRKVDREIEPPVSNFTHPLTQDTMKFLYIDSHYDKLLKNNQRYISFSVDLGEIGLPSQYRILFYTQELKGGQLILDFSNWISVPPPKVSLSLKPNAITDIRNSGEQIVDVFVNSTTGFDQLVTLSTNRTNYINSTFPTNNTFHLPPYDIDTKQIKIKALINEREINENDYPISKTLRITANSTPPPPPVIGSNIEQENTLTNAYLYIKINRPLSAFEQLWGIVTDFNNKVISPINGIWTFLIGVLTVSVPWAIRRFRKRPRYYT
jgi:hypothetical protein